MKTLGGVVLGLLIVARAFAGEGDLSIKFSGGVFHGPEAGDEDPFPLMCANFSGSWRSDAGRRYAITQRQCSYLRVQMFDGFAQNILTIIPDNKVRAENGSQVRHRWNNGYQATVLESHRTLMADAHTRVTEVTMFERASGDLLLETTYRTIEFPDSPNQEIGRAHV